MQLEPSSDPNDILPELPKVISRLAWGGGVLVTLLTAVIFLVIGYQSEVARLESALQVGVHSISKQSARRSGLSGAEFVQESEKVLAALGWLEGDASIRVIDANKHLLAEMNGDLRPPILTRTAPLDFGNHGVGLLEVDSSLSTLSLYSLFMFVPGVMLGWIVFTTLKDMPMRTLRVALEEVSIRKAAEARLEKSLSIFAATLESTADGIFVTEASGREVVTNQRFLEMWNLGSSAGVYTSNNETVIALANQLRDPTAFYSTLRELKNNVDVHHGAILELRDGRRFEWNSQPQFIGGKVVGRVSSFRDISERRLAEALLEIEKDVLEMVVCGNPLKTALGALASHVEVLSGEMFCTILFRDSSEDDSLTFATGRSLPCNVVEGIVHHGQAVLSDVFADITKPAGALKDGTSGKPTGIIQNIGAIPIWSRYCELTAKHSIQACFAVVVRSSDDNLLGLIIAHYRNPAELPPHDHELILVASHLTSIAIERRQAEDRLQVMAHYDALTRLPNRVLFHDRLRQTLARAERSKGLMALLFLDLDRFKAVNDSLGHDSGDTLLCEVSLRLRQCVREVDTVARLGGDEFTLILEQVTAPGDAAAVASKIIEALASPFFLCSQEAFVSPSIGITVYPLDSENAEQLVKNADFAMYRAKEEGGNGYRFFSSEMDNITTDRLDLESGLRHALEREEFVVYYQPKLNLATGAITGAEALLRWQHPTKGLVSPAEFIPILEETGLILPVGEWVLRNVCAQVRKWQAVPALASMVVAVNLSGRQLQHKDLPDIIAAILAQSGLDPEYLELEVTESMLMHDPECAVEILMQIRNKGILHIDVDDFGTGYSSLSYLKQFPIDALKLDKSFVDGLPHDEDDVAISRAVISMAHSLRLTVIAEGVERDEQLAFLRDSGCDIIQGYIVSAPIPADAFGQLVQDSMSHHAPASAGESKKKAKQRQPKLPAY